MEEMLGRIHAVVAGLMYAENFYIVLYDDVRESVRFLYFADRLDPYVAQPEVETPLSEMHNSLTVALLRHGKPLLGPSARLRQEMGVHLAITHGPDSADWLGVPMARADRVCGASGGQGCDPPDRHRNESRKSGEPGKEGKESGRIR